MTRPESNGNPILVCGQASDQITAGPDGASSSYDAKDLDAKRVVEELAKSAAERLPEMEKLCKELVDPDSR